MRGTCVPKGGPSKRTVRGGCVFIPVIQLTMGWSLYRAGMASAFDLRVWLACRLEVESRKGLREGLTPRYSVAELSRRVKAGEKRVRASLRRLAALGLVSWSESEVRFATSPEELKLPDLSGLWEMFDAIPNRKRLIPIPRRMLRFLARGANPSLIAVVFAHAIRCLYFWPDEGFKASGTCKASWVASTFGISLRSAKAARKEIEGLGWLLRGESSQRRMNAFGPDVAINLDWEIPTVATAEALPTVQAAPPEKPSVADVGSTSAELSTVTDSPRLEIAPPPADFRPEIAPPKENKVPPTGRIKNQNSASSGGQTGFSISEGEGEKPPTLRDVVLEDLRDTSRTLELYRQAVDVGLIGPSESERLKFVAAAEHARAIGKENPCGLFIRIVRGKLWAFLTHDDEDRASARLKVHLFGKPRETSQRPSARPSPVALSLSEDARVVREVLAAVNRVGFRGDVFYLLRKERPEWTRERWEKALQELEAEKRCRMGFVGEGLRANSLEGCLPRFDGAIC